MGVNAIGFICVSSSPRYITTSAIAQVTTSLIPNFPNLDLIGVFLNASTETICQTVKNGGLNGVQLHGDESPEFCDEVRSHLAQLKPNIKLIKALRVKDQSGLAQAQRYSDVVDVILLDAY
ncbi:MAG: phosphoribosylanthranilate isomerase, partial [Pseudanabaena sp.]